MLASLLPSLFPTALLFTPQDSGGSLDARLNALEKEVAALKQSGPPKGNENDLRVFWKDGIRLESQDQEIQLRFGGRLQVDALFGGNDDFTAAKKNVEDGAELRRARLYLQGTVTDRYEFKFQYDFADTNKVKAADVWGEVKQLPAVGNFRVGQFYEPISLEQNTSDFDADFMERSVMNALSPARNIGAAFHDAYSGRLVWWAGAFVDDTSNDTGSVQSNGDHALSARVCGLPYDAKDDESFVHVGASASYRTPTTNQVTISTRPESHLAPVFVTTGALNNVSSVEIFGAEFAVQHGPVHAAAEYLVQRLDASALHDPSFAGWYASAGWFITGERLAYNHVDGVFAAPKVARPFGKGDGFGALELAARVSSLDLDSGTVRGGRITDYLFGVNWYLSYNMRFAIDGVQSHVDGIGSVNLLELWFQVTF
jgi:phosphate-selective porin OprO/OprP